MLSEKILPEDVWQHQFLYIFKKELIGESPEALVYKAYDTILQRNITLKVLKHNGVRAKEQLNQARSKTWLSHPNILEYYAAIDLPGMVEFSNEGEGTSVIMTEYASGGNLNDFRNSNPDAAEIDRAFIQVLNGLEYLHRHGIAHGNLKPTNILFGMHSKKRFAKLADFGMTNSEASLNAISFATNIEYTAPEIVQPQGYASENAQQLKADFWAFGVILYEFFSGNHPFGSRKDGMTAERIIHNICNSGYGSLPRAIEPKYVAVVRKCLVKQESLRNVSAKELRYLIEQGLPQSKNIDASEQSQPNMPVETARHESSDLKYASDETIEVSHRIISRKNKPTVIPPLDRSSIEAKKEPTVANTKAMVVRNVDFKSNANEFPSVLMGLGWFLAGALFSTIVLFFLYDQGFLPIQESIVRPASDLEQADQLFIPPSEDEEKRSFMGGSERLALALTDLSEAKANIIPKEPGTAEKIEKATEKALAKPKATSRPGTSPKRANSGSTFSNGFRYTQGMAPQTRNGKWGFVSKRGTTIVPFIYESVQDFNEGYAAVQRGGRWGFVDRKGEEAVPPQYDYVTSYVNGSAAVSLNGKWGFIDSKGLDYGSIRFDYVKTYSENLAAVSVDGLWGFIDRRGNLVIYPQYDNVSSFIDGRSHVTMGSWKHVIDKTGKCVSGC